MYTELLIQLRALARSENSDFSIGDEAAAAIEGLLALLAEARPHVHTGLQRAKIAASRSYVEFRKPMVDARILLERIDEILS